MSTDLAIPESPAALDGVSDPGTVMLAMVEQAKALLQQASGMEGLALAMETKSRGDAIHVYVRQKEMGHEAELAAAEIVRRAERRIGELLRAGQQDGSIRKKESHRNGRDAATPSASDVLNGAAWSTVSNLYTLTDDIDPERFEEGLSQAKATGNLSRANVMRKIIGIERPSPDSRFNDRHELLKGTRRFDSVRFVRETVRNAPDMDMSPHLAQVDWTALDLDDVPEWISSLDSSIRFLTTLKKNLKELIRD